MQKLLVQFVIVALIVRHAVSQSCSLDTNGTAVNTEVLILGAGISGIAAARTLEVNGITDFMVIEAYNRIGGRIRKYGGTTIDRVGLEVGANWIQGLDENDKKRHPIWREWSKCDPDGPEGSFTPDDFTRIYDAEGKEYNIGDYKDIKRDFELAYCKAVDVGKIIGISDDISLENALKKKGWYPDPPTPLDELVEWEGVDFCSAIHPQSISVFHHSRINYTTAFLEDKFDDAKNYLMADEKGYSFVVECLADSFMDCIQLNSTITKIETADDCVCVTVKENDLYCGRYSIVTFSIGVLQASIDNEKSSVFRFEPPLPQWKQVALNTITPVHYGKIHLQFNTKFWRDILKVNDTHPQIILGHASKKRGYYPYFIFDNNRPNTITADVTGELAEEVAEPNKTVTVIDEVMDVLKKMFPNKIPDNEPKNAIISNWSRDPLFRCTFSVLPPGAPDNIYDELLKPVGRLYFAGEALNDTNSGFTQGGYGSGVHVAKNVIKNLDKNNDDGLSAGEIVGIVFGSLAGVTLLGVVIAVVIAAINQARH